MGCATYILNKKRQKCDKKKPETINGHVFYDGYPKYHG